MEIDSIHNPQYERSNNNNNSNNNCNNKNLNLNDDSHGLSEYLHYNPSSPSNYKRHSERKKDFQRLFSSLSYTSQDDQQISSPQHSFQFSIHHSLQHSPQHSPIKSQQSKPLLEYSQSLPTTPYINPTRIIPITTSTHTPIVTTTSQFTLPRSESNTSYSSITIRPHSSPVYFSSFQSPTKPTSSTSITIPSSTNCISFKYLFCSSLETTLNHFNQITEKCQKDAIATLTLPGNVPALNIACLYGNIHVSLFFTFKIDFDYLIRLFKEY